MYEAISFIAGAILMRLATMYCKNRLLKQLRKVAVGNKDEMFAYGVLYAADQVDKMM